MKNLTLIFILLFGHATFFLQVSAEDTSIYAPIRRQIIIKGDQFYPPYEFINEKGEPDGFNIELFKALANELNLDYKLELAPWHQVREELEAGKIDVITGMLVSPYRSEKLRFGIPHSVMTHGLFTHKDSKIRSINDIHELEIIVQRGDIMHDYLIEHQITDRIIAVEDQLEALRLLEKNQHDAALLGNFQGMHLIKNYKIKDVVLRSSDIEPQRYAMAVKKDNDALLWTLNMGLYQLKANGTYDELYNKWFSIYERGYYTKKIRPYILGLLAFISLLVFFVIILRKRVKQALKKQKESEDKLLSLSKVAPIGLGMIKNDIILEVNDYLLQILGYKRKEIEGKNIRSFFETSEEFNRIKNIILQQINSDNFGFCEAKIINKSGEYIYTIITAGSMDDTVNNDTVIFTLADVTSHKQNTNLINEANERLRFHLENTPLGVIEIDKNLRIKVWSRQAEKIFGWSADETIGKTEKELNMIHEEDEEFVCNALKQLAAGHFKRNVIINKNINKNGNILHCEWYNSAIYNDNGELISIFSLINNVTDLRKAEKQVQEEQQRLKWSVDAADIGTWEWNIQSNRIRCNDNYYNMLGYGPGELNIDSFDSWEKMVHPEDLAESKKLLMNHLENPDSIYETELRMRHKNGGWLSVLDRGRIISHTPQGLPLIMVGTHTDISRIKEAEKQIRQNEARLQSMVNLMQQDTNNIRQLFDYVLEEAIKLTESQIGFIYSYNQDNNQFQMQAVSQKTMANCRIDNWIECLELDQTGMWGESVKQKRPLIYNNFTKEIPLRKGYPEGHIPIEKYLTVPVIIDGITVLVVGLANKRNDYTQHDILQTTLLMDTIWHVTEKRKSDKELQKLSVATQQSPASVIITDIDGIIEYVNQKYLDTTGYKKEEMIGKPLTILKPDHTTLEEHNNIWRSLKNGHNWKGEHQNQKKSGDYYWESVSLSPIFDDKGIITNFVMVSEDISYDKQLQSELIEAKEKAEENDKLKTAFLNNLSHEVRTPLNAIVGFSELIDDDTLASSKKSFYAKSVVKSSKQLLSLIENIVSIAVIEAGQVKINESETNINHLLNDVYNQMIATNENKEVKLKLVSSIDRCNEEIITDPGKLTQILTNLIDNALKFTPKGYVTFGCSKNERYLNFFVEDNGVGFPMEIHDELFQKFRQGTNSISGLQSGMGLGLTIAKSYIDILNGSISIQSDPEKGTKIEIKLPYKPKQNNMTDETSISPIPGGKTILVADDVEINHLLIVEMLEELKLNVLYARNGIEAIKMIERLPAIELILMDIKMPGMDGYKATAEIKKLKPEIIIIAQTAYALAGDKNKAQEAGCDDYISKPIDRKELIRVLSQYLK
ncbi:PAS domain S-box protein [Alkalitalea saponilacus]|uniref:histidine kinase n=1 Tax=Alkalitalea saponilacus TaxID=889453 RepID=A0A1T5F8J6_9BACT|nr:PAS domain S-box protein [Alkalitalea saponilacus]ASB50133.1 hypothetical protein CDL62_13790 [Alkalitalea saponilacus]SKB92499.1 PAS domain S-box-containing protein [Alkalitalea saponilacus]